MGDRKPTFDEIKARRAATTPGHWEPWTALLNPHERGVIIRSDQPEEIGEVLFYIQKFDSPTPQDGHDVHFIAHAPADIDALIEMVEAKEVRDGTN